MRESAEFRFAWLECDVTQARARFEKAHPSPRWLELFEIQAVGIEDRRQALMGAMEPQIVPVVNEDGSDRLTEDIAAALLAGWPRASCAPVGPRPRRFLAVLCGRGFALSLVSRLTMRLSLSFPS
jgi:hypothetical protein